MRSSELLSANGLEAELTRLPKLRDRFPALLAEIRETGVSRIESELQQGGGGIAAPSVKGWS